VIKGLDLSELQGPIPAVQWQAIAADVRFVYLRAGVGNDPADSRFTEYLAGARAAGLVVGAYNFAYPLPNEAGHPGRDPEDQAQAHYAACEGLGSEAADLPMSLDLEWPAPEAFGQWGCSPAQIVDWTVRYLAKATALYGRAPVLYSYPYFIKALAGADLSPLAVHPLWLASYQPVPAVPSPWTECAIQQTTGGGYRLPNGAPCDTNVMTEAWLAALTGS
jgi:lysozyme